MNRLEDRVRAATQAAAQTVIPGSTPPLRLPGRPPRRPAGRWRHGQRWAGWMIPLAAAAAVTAVLATSVAISGAFRGHQHADGPVTPGPAGVPRYYVALRFSPHNRCCDTPLTRAVVMDTATGTVLATVTPPRPYVTFAGVTGAGDDRTFVLAAQRTLSQPTARFFLLRINPGRPAGQRARLRRLPVPASTSGILNFALSPDGRLLAVTDDRGLQVLDLSSGAERTWPSGLGGGMLGNGTTDALLSWAADSRDLAFAYNSDSSQMGAYLLDTRATGGNLLADSRRLVHATAPGTNATPWYQVRLTADGGTVIGVLAAPNHHNPRGAAQKLEEFSARTGRLLRVLNYLPVWNYTDVEQVLWTSPSGHTLVVANTKPYQGGRRAFFLLGHAGLLTGHHFTPLPWYTDTLAAAW